MINLHVFPDYLVHASRVRRMTETVAGTGMYTKVILVGRSGPNLPSIEDVDSTRTIVRLPGPESRNPLLRAIGFLAWSTRVVRRFWSAPVRTINCHSLSAMPGCIALKWRHRAHLVYEPHELESETSRMIGVTRTLARWIERLMLPTADQVIVVSQSIESWYRSRQSVTKCLTVPNCPRYQQPKPNRELRQRFGVPDHVPIFLYQGILNRGRGVELLCKAFQDLQSEAALVLLGYGPLAPGKLVSDGAVHWHPAVSPDALLEITSSADIGLSIIEPISLSYEYCLPTKLFHYIMARKPVIVSNTVEQARVVREFNIGLVVDHTSVTAVRQAVRDMARIDLRLFRPGLDRASRELCWERTEPLLRSMHQNFLDKGLEQTRLGQRRTFDD